MKSNNYNIGAERFSDVRAPLSSLRNYGFESDAASDSRDECVVKSTVYEDDEHGGCPRAVGSHRDRTSNCIFDRVGTCATECFRERTKRAANRLYGETWKDSRKLRKTSVIPR